MMSPTSALLLPAVHVSPSPGAPPHDDVSSSSECSSIGSASSDGEEEESSEASKDAGVTSSLGSLGSLEDSLPIKKGLSSHFVGKSRSFSNLTECESGDAVDLAKEENPFNKRRRIQIASRISYRRRRASCSSLVVVPLPPLLSPEHALPEETEEEEEEEDDDDDHDSNGGRIIAAGKGRFPLLAPAPPGGKLIFNDKIKIMGAKGAMNIKSTRSFALFDL